MIRRLRALARRLRNRSDGSRPLLWIAGLCLAVELAILLGTVLTGADLRLRVIARLGFWPELLDGWRPQAVWMFLTYWLVHTGPVHLLGNLLVLLWISLKLSPRLYATDTWLIWTSSVVGGGVAFALLGSGPASMVGASGGVFGLIGALIAIGYRYTGRSPALLGAAALKAGLACLALLLLSLADIYVRGPVLAWQAHLGGFLGGGLIAALGPYREGLASRRS